MCSELLKSTTSPEGFVYDKSTGLYFEASNMHWHCKANLYKTEDGTEIWPTVDGVGTVFQ